MDERLDILLEHVNAAIRSNIRIDRNILSYFSQIELAIEEERKSLLDYSNIFCFHLIFLLIFNELRIAQHLIQRIPDRVIESPEFLCFRELRNVATYLSMRDTCQALISSTNFVWSEELEPGIALLQHSIREQRWQAAAKSYKSVGLLSLALSLHLPDDVVAQECIQRGWKIDAAAQIVFIPESQATDATSTSSSFVAEGNLLTQLCSYVSSIQSKPVTIDYSLPKPPPSGV